MTLNVQPDGTVNVDGQPFPLAAFWRPTRYQAKPTSILVRQLPYLFTVPLPNGATIAMNAGDYLVVDETGKPIGGMTAVQLAAGYETGPGQGTTV